MSESPVIVLTRPAAQSGATTQALRDAGYTVRNLPLLDIVELPETAALQRRCVAASRADTLIVTSRNAARVLLRLARRPWPARVVSVGRGTAQTLEDGGIGPVVHPPERFDSDGVLEMPELQTVRGQHIVVAAGIGGRRRLLLELRRRGARVDKLPLYRRAARAPSPDTLDSAVTGAAAVVLSSSAGLHAWAALTLTLPPGQRPVCALVVPSARVLQHAHKLGLPPPIWMPARMDDEALVALLSERAPVHC